MSPNLVFQQVISHHKSRLSPSMSISTLETSMVDSQSMVSGKTVNTFFHTLKWICTTNISFRQFTPLQQQNKWAWTASHPTPSATAFHRSNPTNLFSLRSLRILWFLRFPIFGGLVFFLNGEGLDLESVQSQQKESGRSNWAAGGETVDAQPMLDDGGEGFLWLRDYSLFFSLAKIAS